MPDALREGRDLYARVIRLGPVLNEALQQARGALEVLRRTRTRVQATATPTHAAQHQQQMDALAAHVRRLTELKEDRNTLERACRAYTEALMAPGGMLTREVYEGHVRRQVWFTSIAETVRGPAGGGR